MNVTTFAGMCVNHCFHGTGMAYYTHPASYQERCCHCGYFRNFQPTWPAEPAHGPYAPERYTVTYSNNTGEIK